MQSPELLKQLAEIDRLALENRLQKFWESRLAGNWTALRDLLDPEIRVTSPGARGLAPGGPPFSGADAVIERARRTHVQFECLGSEILELLIDGDRTVVQILAHLRDRGSGELSDWNVTDFVRFRDGLIVELVEYSDPDQGGPEDPPP